MSAQEYLSYTYLIGWSRLDRWYYGVRWANKCKPEDDLWVHYFTSSKHVKEFRKQHGEPDIIQVRRKFSKKETAREWEYRILKRIGAVGDDRWLNKNHSLGPPTMRGENNPFFGKTHSDEFKQWLSDKRSGENNPNYGKPLSTCQKLHLSETRQGDKNHMFGKKHSPEAKQKMSESSKGKKHSEGAKRKVSKSVVIDGIIYYGRRDAAEQLEVHENTIRNWIKSGKAIDLSI